MGHRRDRKGGDEAASTPLGRTGKVPNTRPRGVWILSCRS